MQVVKHLAWQIGQEHCSAAAFIHTTYSTSRIGCSLSLTQLLCYRGVQAPQSKGEVLMSH